MSAGADSIRPVALDFTPEVEAAARALAGLRDSFLPPRAPEAVRGERRRRQAAAVALPAAPRVPSIDAPLFTAVAFRPDGRRALAIELTLTRFVLLSIGTLAALSGAIALGWLIGEWTARL